MPKVERLTVYCGSSPMVEETYFESAREFGHELSRRKIGLVYGGANIGMMGALADAVLESGGKAYGVMPRFLEEKEIAHRGLIELVLVDTMHERKTRMAERGDGFVALPGGLGTLEEWLEALTWGQLGHHSKPCAILNVSGYYDEMLAMLRRGCEDHFIRKEHYDMIISEKNPTALLDAIEAYRAPHVEKWLKREGV